MEHPDREAEPYFSKPIQQIVLMVAVLCAVGAGTALAYPVLYPVISANLWLNGFIIAVFFIGVIACFAQLYQVFNCVQWIEGFAAHRVGHDIVTPPQLLAPLATLLRTRGARMQLGATSSRSILDSVAQRIDEQREITRYLVSLLIFLGLLGTFFGLATTVPALVETIRSLTPNEGETGLDVFGRLQVGLESQLDGMGVAFASSLLGLAGSLVIGLLELFAGHGQNRFYRELEEWVSSITRVSLSGGDGDAGGETGAMAQILDHMAEQMESMQLMFTQSDISRSMTDEKISQLTTSMERVADKLAAPDSSADALARIAEGQERLIAAIGEGGTGEGMDAESRMRLRSIDVQLLRLLEEVSAGRQEAIAELRTDIAGLARALKPSRRGQDQAAKRGEG
ncbi:MAG: biopolymer transporter ExbB [Rhodobacteraceae bacterium]|nr:biopolymer transporter ExbB [Paracoccaceae bacterium]